MAIKKKPFTRQSIEGSGQQTVTVKMNKERWTLLRDAQQQLNQSKDSTALWQLAEVGAKVLRSPKMKTILETIFNNKRKNRRTGVDAEFE